MDVELNTGCTRGKRSLLAPSANCFVVKNLEGEESELSECPESACHECLVHAVSPGASTKSLLEAVPQRFSRTTRGSLEHLGGSQFPSGLHYYEDFRWGVYIYIYVHITYIHTLGSLRSIICIYTQHGRGTCTDPGRFF